MKKNRQAVISHEDLVGVLGAFEAGSAMPSPISTPFTALIDIIAAARSVSSLP